MVLVCIFSALPVLSVSECDCRKLMLYTGSMPFVVAAMTYNDIIFLPGHIDFGAPALLRPFLFLNVWFALQL
jgi:hypothetical protein